jgi:hypothetical protein
MLMGGGGEGEGRAGDLVGGFASELACDFFSDSAHEFSGETLDHLRPQADARDGEELLDAGAVELDSVGATDAVNHFYLQRNDGHRGKGVRKKFEGTVQNRVFENCAGVIEGGCRR